ncbi:hypothetical protein HAX54_037955 [Datura stramonium]|uniref:Uncharacterized protein n=1 Tax=Datura stramonium TaxID=4076 RepID=A0ABS8SHQ7_DATST|nr:hypothetical protein [Datura stramonium]
MKIENEATGVTRSIMVEIQYDYVPKYCFECNMQGYDDENCRVLKQYSNTEMHTTQQSTDSIHAKQEYNGQQAPRLQKGNAKILSSGKIVCDPGRWNVVRDNRCRGSSDEVHLPTLTNKFQALASEEIMQAKNNNTNNIIIHTSSLMEKYKDSNNKSKASDDGESTSPSLKEQALVQIDSPIDEQEKPAIRDNANCELVIDMGRKENCTLEEEELDNRAIILLPAAVQTDDSMVIMVQRVSPITVLYEIITHKGIGVDSEKPTVTEDSTHTSELKEEQICKDAYLSPRVLKVLKTNRKVKKQDKREELPVKVQPRREATSRLADSQ